MPTTEHIHLPLYTDEETPDLSTTGHYNEAIEILDNSTVYVNEMLDRERAQREDRDAELDGLISTEELARTSADTALGARIDNAETEISANSADLTGIKGLTYGSDHVQLVEISNGEYGSPALDEIFEQMGNRVLTFKNAITTSRLDAESLAVLNSAWPNVLMLSYGDEPGESAVFCHASLPHLATETTYQFVCYTTNAFSQPQEPSPIVEIVEVDSGTGDITVSYQPITTGITGNTTWGEIEQP